VPNINAMITPKDSQAAMIFARAFGTLSDPNRLLILKALGSEEKPVNRIAIDLGLSQPLVSHHLAALKAGGLVKAKKAGSFVFYSVSTEKIAALVNNLEDALEDISKNIELTTFPQPVPRFMGRGRRGRRWM